MENEFSRLSLNSELSFDDTISQIREKIKGLRDALALLLSSNDIAKETLPLSLPDELEEILDSFAFQTLGFLGDRGTGKTSTINSFLECELLPEGAFSHTTAAITEVCGWKRNYYSATVYFIQMEDWIKEWNEFCEVCSGILVILLYSIVTNRLLFLHHSV